MIKACNKKLVIKKQNQTHKQKQKQKVRAKGKPSQAKQKSKVVRKSSHRKHSHNQNQNPTSHLKKKEKENGRRRRCIITILAPINQASRSPPAAVLLFFPLQLRRPPRILASCCGCFHLHRHPFNSIFHFPNIQTPCGEKKLGLAQSCSCSFRHHLWLPQQKPQQQ